MKNLYDFFKIIFYIEFFVFPISAGLLSYAAIRGNRKKTYIIATVQSFIMLILSLFGVYINAPPEVTDSSALQSLNAESPIEVTESGISTEVSALQPSNADSPIAVTDSGIITDLRDDFC